MTERYFPWVAVAIFLGTPTLLTWLFPAMNQPLNTLSVLPFLVLWVVSASVLVFIVAWITSKIELLLTFIRARRETETF